MKTILFILSCFLTSLFLSAQIIHVPADYPTIQDGINAADIYDTILVAPGTYIENIWIPYQSKITLASHFLTTQDTSYISQTIIQGEEESYVSVINNYGWWGSYSDSCHICGFKIVGWDYGCIGLAGQGHWLDHLVITGNPEVTGEMPALSLSGSAMVSNLRVIDYATLSVMEPEIISIFDEFAGGGSDGFVLDNVEITGNQTVDWGCIIRLGHCPVEITNSVINNNSGGDVIGSAYDQNPSGDTVSITFDNVDIRNNAGGDVFNLFLINSTLLTLNEVEIYDNNDGRAINGFFGDLSMSGVSIHDNNGGIYGLGDITFDTVNRCSIYSNANNYELFDISLSIHSSIVLDTFTVITPTSFYAANPELHTWDIRHGVFLSESQAVLKDMKVIGNSAEDGGGMYCENSNITMKSCEIAGNSAGHEQSAKR